MITDVCCYQRALSRLIWLVIKSTGLKEVDYSSGDTGELLKRLASDGVTRQRSSPKKASETPRMPNPSKSNRSTKRQSKKKRKDKKNRKAKRNNNTAVASGRRWTRRSDDSDLSVSGSSKLLGLGKPTIRPNQLTPFVSVGSSLKANQWQL